MSRATAHAIVAGEPLLPIAELAPAPKPPRARRVPVRAHLRTVAGASTPPTGAERRDTALLKLEAKEVTVAAREYVRAKLVALYESRTLTMREPYVTADDVETILRDWPECPDEAKPAHGPQHWRGTVFRGRGWKQTGRVVPSLRPHMNATALPCWRPVLTDELGDSE